ncbi:MAG: hypothetical protein HY343_12465 [Lentisphaerae bacterium]|nr:hypothetical protein [Lentisphaerota bacterium]
MKTTIDIPEDIYRKVKAKSALEGRPVRDVTITLFRAWIEQSKAPLAGLGEKPPVAGAPSTPTWFASLRKYAHNARGRYDMGSVRRSIARGRASEERLS